MKKQKDPIALVGPFIHSIAGKAIKRGQLVYLDSDGQVRPYVMRSRKRAKQEIMFIDDDPVVVSASLAKNPKVFPGLRRKKAKGVSNAAKEKG